MINSPFQLAIGVHEDLGGKHFKWVIDKALMRKATALQIFSKSSRSYWYNQDAFKKKSSGFKEHLEEQGLRLLTHVGFYVNLCSNSTKNWNDSILSLKEEILAADLLGAEGVVLHPGAAVGGGLQDFKSGVDQATEALLKVFFKFKPKTKLLLESMPGAGSQICGDLEEMATLVNTVNTELGYKALGVCFDTAHSFVCGYDFFSSKEAYDFFWDTWQEFIGISNLGAFHLNGAKFKFASKKDRHDNLDSSQINPECFKWFINDYRFKDKIFILETPKDNHEHNLSFAKSLLVG